MKAYDRPEKTQMYFEWNWPSFWRGDQILNILDVHIDIQHHGDHSPGFNVCLVIFNLKLLDFGYYNIHHAPDMDEYRVVDENFTGKTFWLPWEFSFEPWYGCNVFPEGIVFSTYEHAADFILRGRLPKDTRLVQVALLGEWDRVHPRTQNKETPNEG